MIICLKNNENYNIEILEESVMLIWEIKVRENIEEKIIDMGEDRKIK